MPSATYKDNIYAPLRKTKGSILFELVAPEAKEKATDRKSTRLNSSHT